MPEYPITSTDAREACCLVCVLYSPASPSKMAVRLFALASFPVVLLLAAAASASPLFQRTTGSRRRELLFELRDASLGLGLLNTSSLFLPPLRDITATATDTPPAPCFASLDWTSEQGQIFVNGFPFHLKGEDLLIGFNPASSSTASSGHLLALSGLKMRFPYLSAGP